METVKKFIAFFLLFVLLCAYLGSVLVSIIVVWPVAWYMAIGQIAVTALSGPAAWAVGKVLFAYIFATK